MQACSLPKSSPGASTASPTPPSSSASLSGSAPPSNPGPWPSSPTCRPLSSRPSAAPWRSPPTSRPRQEQLLKLLGGSGGMTPAEIWAALKVSKQGAMDLLRPLVKAGLVKRVGSLKTGRHVLFGQSSGCPDDILSRPPAVSETDTPANVRRFLNSDSQRAGLKRTPAWAKPRWMAEQNTNGPPQPLRRDDPIEPRRG